MNTWVRGAEAWFAESTVSDHLLQYLPAYISPEDGTSFSLTNMCGISYLFFDEGDMENYEEYMRSLSQRQFEAPFQYL